MVKIGITNLKYFYTAKTAAKWQTMIIFRIFKCLWNNLIETLHLGGLGGSNTSESGAKQAKIILIETIHLGGM